MFFNPVTKMNLPAVERDEASHLHAVLHEGPMNSDIIVIHFWIVTHIPEKI